jgi:flagellar biosynthesis/type III secretory pathway protein FliH
VLENQEKALQSLATVLRYLTVTAERVTPEQMRQALEPVLRYEGDELMSTLAQQWLEQGRQEGWQEGRQEGRQEVATQEFRNHLDWKHCACWCAERQRWIV